MSNSSDSRPRSLPSAAAASAPPAPTYSIEGALDLYTAPDLREALLARTDPRLVLDLGKVASCDLAGLQLLLAARRSAAQAGRTLTFGLMAPAIPAAAEALGLGASFLSND